MAGRMINGAAALAELIRPASDTDEIGVHRVLPVLPELSGLLPGRGLRRGSTVAVATGRAAPAGGGTSLLLALLSAASQSGSWCAVVGVPALGALAAAESGIALDRLALVPNPGPDWPTVVAALIDGVDLVVTAVPGPISSSIAGRLAARARQRGSVLVPFGSWTGADLTLQVTQGRWEGLGQGHGRLRRRRVTVLARGRGAAARPRELTMWMPGVTIPLPGPPRGTRGLPDLTSVTAAATGSATDAPALAAVPSPSAHARGVAVSSWSGQGRGVAVPSWSGRGRGVAVPSPSGWGRGVAVSSPSGQVRGAAVPSSFVRAWGAAPIRVARRGGSCSDRWILWRFGWGTATQQDRVGSRVGASPAVEASSGGVMLKFELRAGRALWSKRARRSGRAGGRSLLPLAAAPAVAVAPAAVASRAVAPAVAVASRAVAPAVAVASRVGAASAVDLAQPMAVASPVALVPVAVAPAVAVASPVTFASPVAAGLGGQGGCGLVAG